VRQVSSQLGGKPLNAVDKRIMLNMLKTELFGDKDPIRDPVWWLLVCPVCGKKMLAPPGSGCIHVSDNHAEPYVLVCTGVTWKQARETFNVDDVLGLGLRFPPEPSMEDWRKHREFVKAMDALAGVQMKGVDNFLSGKRRWKNER
jgi:hypothetical protein